MASAHEEVGLLESTRDPERESLIGDGHSATRTYGVFHEERTFLASVLAQEPRLPFVRIESSSSVPFDNNLVSSSLRAVGKMIVRPYDIIFKLVGWKPLFPRADEPWLKALNLFHPVVVLLIIIFGYVVQWEGCFGYSKERWENKCQNPSKVIPANITNCTLCTTGEPITSTHGGVTQHPVVNGTGTCAKTMLFQFAIMNVLHTISYLYSLYSMRCAEPEQFVSLLERVFLFMKQLGMDLEAEKRIVKSSRRLLYAAVLWLALCLAGDIMYLVSRFEYLYIPWICTHLDRIILCCAVLVSFTLLNAVYVIVVVTYAVQCRLLALYMECLIKRIRENTISLFDSMEKCDEFRREVNKLNHNAGISVSIMLVNFAAIIVIDGLSATDSSAAPEKNLPGSSFVVWYISNVLSVVLTIVLVIVILVEAVNLSRRCRLLHKMGMEVRVRSPLKFEFDPKEEDPARPTSPRPQLNRMNSQINFLLEDRLLPMKIDTFLQYMASLRFSAKLFMVPVRGGYVCLIAIATGFGIFFVYQLQDISASLYALRG